MSGPRARRRGLLAATLVLLALPFILCVLSMAAALQREPAVAIKPVPDAEDAARAVRLVRTHDPRHGAPGQVSAAQLSERDLDVLLNHAAQRWWHAATQVSLQQRGALVRSSVHLGDTLQSLPFGRWLNVELRLTETPGLPEVESLHVGSLRVPAVLVPWLLRQAAQRAGLQHEMDQAARVVRQVRFRPQQMVVVYAWQADSAERMLGALLTPPEQERLRAYHQHLVQLAARQPPGVQPLTPWMQSMFQLAQQRTAAGGDAAAENRAALAALTLFANGRSVADLVPGGQAWPRAQPQRFTLQQREDFPLHFLVSAALAAEGTGPLSRAIGIYKEIVDSRGGTGFSFNDLAANRAGIRIGEMAVAQPRELQTRLAAAGLRETDFMPSVHGLPEFMSEPEFLRRFGGIGAPAYESMMAEIERRVASLPVMR